MERGREGEGGIIRLTCHKNHFSIGHLWSAKAKTDPTRGCNVLKIVNHEKPSVKMKVGGNLSYRAISAPLINSHRYK